MRNNVKENETASVFSPSIHGMIAHNRKFKGVSQSICSGESVSFCKTTVQRKANAKFRIVVSCKINLQMHTCGLGNSNNKRLINNDDHNDYNIIKVNKAYGSQIVYCYLWPANEATAKRQQQQR